MDASPPSREALDSPSSAGVAQNDDPTPADPTDPNPTAELQPPSEHAIDDTKSAHVKTKMNAKKNKNKNKKNLCVDGFEPPSSSASSAGSNSYSPLRGVRVASKQRNPRVLIGSASQKEGDVEALALPLGMSIAAVVAQVLERKEATGETMAVDHLSTICTLAVRESLANVFGNKFDSFARNFEASFRSTLMTLRLINESSQYTGERPRDLDKKNNYSSEIPPISPDKECGLVYSSCVRACQSEVIQHNISSEERFDTLEEIERNPQTDSTNQELALHDGEINRQLACVPTSKMHSVIAQSMLSTLEKSVVEQTRSNDLKTYEIGLTMKKLQLKEKQLALNSDLNFLERCKLSMGVSKASFKAEKFKNEIEETRHAELLKKCIDCLVAGLLIMLVSIAYGTYTYSHNRITEATTSCMPSEESKSWWMPKPMASFNSGLLIVLCQVQVVSRMLFGMLMIFSIAYLLLQRSTISTETMPVTFILLLGVACGFAGKLCIETLGGNGYHWLLCWEVLCLLHLFSSLCTSALFRILYGPIILSPWPDRKSLFPYWLRRILFYATLLLVLPLLCGLVPFASVSEWKDHFSARAIDFLQTTSD